MGSNCYFIIVENISQLCEQLQKSNLIKKYYYITAFIFETLSKYIYIVKILKGIDDLLRIDIIFKNKYC